MLEDPEEGSGEERRMAEAGLQKKVKRRKRKKSTACRGERRVAQCWKRGQRGVRRKEPGGGSGRRAPEVDQERYCL